MVGFWPTPAYSDTEFLEKRTTASHPKAELLESLIIVLRMHPNGQMPPSGSQLANGTSVVTLITNNASTE